MDALGVAPQDVQSYGKGAIVGSAGALEHTAAILHPKPGTPFREVVGGGATIIPSAKKRGGQGTTPQQASGNRTLQGIEPQETTMHVEETPGAKMIYLIKRKPTTSREELVMHWFANHVPAVIQSQKDAAAAGKPHARRYIALLFDANRDGEHPWDGMAQLWWEKPLPRPQVPRGTTPTDTFQQKAEPYVPWATKEYVVIDSADRLPAEPLTLNAPFPSNPQPNLMPGSPSSISPSRRAGTVTATSSSPMGWRSGSTPQGR